MVENYGDAVSPEQQYFSDVNTKLRDIEERQRILKERILLIGKNLIEDRESIFNENQEIKKQVLKLKEQNLELQTTIKKILNQLSETARKEELLILQRQFDIFQPHIK